MEKKNCFILMPYTQAGNLKKVDLDFIYQHIIKVAVDEFEYEGKKYFHRIHKFESKLGSIIDGIVKDLSTADLVIADLTGLNPNVMYELGVRHALKRGTIIISQDLNNLASDLRDYMTVGYAYSKTTSKQPDNYQQFKVELHKSINEIVASDKIDSPVLNYFKEKKRFKNEEDESKFLENAIIIDLITSEYLEIQIMIEKLKKENFKVENAELFYQLFNSRLNNLDIAINELKITHKSSILYEQITNSKTIFQEVRNIFNFNKYLSSFNIDEFKKVFSSHLDIKRCIEQPLVNLFALVDGRGLVYTNIDDLFKEEGTLEFELIEYLEEYLDLTAKELGIDMDKVDKALIT